MSNSKKKYRFELGVFCLSFLPFLIGTLTFYLTSKHNFENEVSYLGNDVFSSIRDKGEIKEVEYQYNDSPLYRLCLFNKDEEKPFFDSSNKYDKTYSRYELFAKVGHPYYQKEEKNEYFYETYFSATNDIYIIFGKKVDFVVPFSLYFCSIGSALLFGLDATFAYFYIKKKKKEFNLLQIQVKKLRKLADEEPLLEYEDSTEFYVRSLRDSRRQVDYLLSKAKQEAKENQFVLDSFSQGLVVLNNKNEIISLNKKAIDIFSLSSDYKDRDLRLLDIAPKTVKEMSTVNKTRIKSIFFEQIGSRIYKIEVAPLEFEKIKKEDNYPSVASILIDVTEEYNADKMKKDFVANASHELKSPITSILGYSQLISEGLIEDKKEVIETSDKIEKEAKRMSKIVFNLLRLSSIENNQLRTIGRINLEKGIKDLVESIRLQIEKKDLEVNIDIPADMEIKMNEMDFQDLFLNLIDNAVKYNKEGGRISIKADKKENFVAIEDNGIGISKENLSRIFERFYRVDKARSRKDGGTGLGLSIAKYVASYYGYSLDVSSTLGEGSKFTCYFESKDNEIK